MSRRRHLLSIALPLSPLAKHEIQQISAILRITIPLPDWGTHNTAHTPQHHHPRTHAKATHIYVIVAQNSQHPRSATQRATRPSGNHWMRATVCVGVGALFMCCGLKQPSRVERGGVVVPLDAHADTKCAEFCAIGPAAAAPCRPSRIVKRRIFFGVSRLVCPLSRREWFSG